MAVLMGVCSGKMIAAASVPLGLDFALHADQGEFCAADCVVQASLAVKPLGT
jgi:hypothetical protein